MFAVCWQLRAFNKTLEHIDRPFFLGSIWQASHQSTNRIFTQHRRDETKITVDAAGFKAVVSGKNFISSLPGEAHRDLLLCLLAEQVEGHDREIGHGLVQMVERFFHIIGIEGIQIENLMIGLEMARHDIRILQLGIGGILIADGEGLQGPTDMPPHERDNAARIQPAGQKHAQGHISL